MSTCRRRVLDGLTEDHAELCCDTAFCCYTCLTEPAGLADRHPGAGGVRGLHPPRPLGDDHESRVGPPDPLGFVRRGVLLRALRLRADLVQPAGRYEDLLPSTPDRAHPAAVP